MLPQWATTKRKSANHESFNTGIRKLIFTTGPSLGQNHRLDLFLFNPTFKKHFFFAGGIGSQDVTPLSDYTQPIWHVAFGHFKTKK